MVVCVGGSGSGKTLLLKLLCDKQFNKDTALVPTVGVNLYNKDIKSGKKRAIVSIRELGGELAPLWLEYLRSETSLIFVINTLNLGQLGLVGVKLCECLSQLEKNSIVYNQVARLCVLWTREGCVKTVTKLLKLKELLHNSSVVLTEIKFEIDSLCGLTELEHWLGKTHNL